MNGRISWLGVFMRLVGAVAVVLLTYNPTHYCPNVEVGIG
jgi:hypothetical protein